VADCCLDMVCTNAVAKTAFMVVFLFPFNNNRERATESSLSDVDPTAETLKRRSRAYSAKCPARPIDRGESVLRLSGASSHLRDTRWLELAEKISRETNFF